MGVKIIPWPDYILSPFCISLTHLSADQPLAGGVTLWRDFVTLHAQQIDWGLRRLMA